MNTDVIVLKQLPVIEEQLLRIKEEVTAATKDALALVCTEDSVRAVKQKRAELNKVFTAFEERRKEIKTQILAPYDAFEKTYRDCITEPFRSADRELAGKITTVENGLKHDKANALAEYFAEYRQSVGLSAEDAPLEKARINVTLSASLKSLKEQAARYVDETLEDISMIATQEDHDEILAEYRRSGNAAQSVMVVAQRHKEIEDERRRTEERKAAEEARAAAAAKVDEAISETVAEAVTAPQEAFAPPVEQIPADVSTHAETTTSEVEEVYEATFTVRATMKQLKTIKEFLDNGGYQYE